MKFVALFFALLASGVAYGQDTAAEITATQVTVYRTGMDIGCRDAGRRGGDPQAKVDGFCNCMMETLDKNMASEEWKQAFLHSSKKRDRDEMLVLRPHMPKVQACRAGS